MFEHFVELTLEKLNDIFEYPDSNLIIKLQYPFQIHVINSVTLLILRNCFICRNSKTIVKCSDFIKPIHSAISEITKTMTNITNVLYSSAAADELFE